MKSHSIPIALLRCLLAAVFIFSGFVKAVDPWGTAIKLNEYFTAFGMPWLSGVRYLLAVAQAALEMMLGLALLFRVRELGVMMWTVAVTAFFTMLTLVLAMWNPVADCGCFGDAVKLTNWQTFGKNVILLAVGLVLLSYVRRHSNGEWPLSRRVEQTEWRMLLLFLVVPVALGMYALRHLPPIDFLPYRIGASLTAEQSDTSQHHTTVVYRDRTTGREREFALEDTTWYDSLRWEYIATKVQERTADTRRTQILPATLFDASGDHTAELLGERSEVFLIVLADLDRPLEGRARERLARTVDYALQNGYAVVGVTASPLPEAGHVAVGEQSIPIYNMDGTTLKMLLRAVQGVVLVKEGTVLGKWNARDVPRFDREDGTRSPLATVLLVSQCTVTAWWLGTMGAVGVIGYFVYRRFRRRN